MKHKDHYNDDYILDISQRILSVMPDFDREAFVHNLTGQFMSEGLQAKASEYGCHGLPNCLPH